MFRTLPRPLAWAGAAVLAASLAAAQIERLDLGQMVNRTDNAVHGRVVETGRGVVQGKTRRDESLRRLR